MRQRMQGCTLGVLKGTQARIELAYIGTNAKYQGVGTLYVGMAPARPYIVRVHWKAC